MNFQVGTALLETCVLAVLSKENLYGYILTQNIKEIIDISESTLYPILRRLQKENFLTVYDMSFGGRNRRYYQVTDLGKEKLNEYIHEWNDYKKRIDKILGGTSNE